MCQHRFEFPAAGRAPFWVDLPELTQLTRLAGFFFSLANNSHFAAVAFFPLEQDPEMEENEKPTGSHEQCLLPAISLGWTASPSVRSYKKRSGAFRTTMPWFFRSYPTG